MGKKKFIDKKRAATFELCPRDTSDPRYSDSPGGDKVFLRVDQNPITINGFTEEEEDGESRFEDAPEDYSYGYSNVRDSSNSLPDDVRKEILELGYPDDGYNYLEHLREIKNTGGGSNFYANPKFDIDQLPRDVKAYDASRVRISGVIEDEKEANERLMYSVASKTVNVKKVQKAIDPEVAALLENSDGSEFGSDVEDLEEDFVIQANLTQPGESSGFKDELEVTERHEASQVTDNSMPEEDSHYNANPRVRREIDELFDQLELNEYGSDNDSESDGDYRAEDGKEQEKFMAQSVNLMNEKLEDYDIEGGKYMNPADLLKNSKVVDKEELDSAAHLIRRCVEYGKKYEAGIEEVEELVEESSDESEQWDCETIVTTYSNLDNHPGKIYVPDSARKKKLSETVAKALSSNDKHIALHGKEKLPAEFLPGKKTEQPARKVEEFVAIPRKAHGQETKEEKKERKLAVKTERREARRLKKETKELYRGETQRAQRTVAVSGPSSIHL